MYWTPPKVRTTPRLRTAYKLLNYIEKRCYTPTRNGKGFWLTQNVQYELDKITKIISEEQRVLLRLEMHTEPLYSEMENSIITNETKSLPFQPPDETNFL